MGLKKAIEGLDKAVKDLTSLHVQTYTGETTISVDSDKPFADMLAVIEAGKTDAKLVLVAETLAKFDGDSYNFVKKNLDDVPDIALEVHKNAVKAGIETRIGLLGLFKGLIK
ncbi:hypothetical protein [uncultured Kordia sp.]|uniref:hypothetical protein n=1 Tax=uncultured Kordia sp. TaxID=507699 RepID=UPI002613DBCD|nr:hypothetical protein [uncultured Kordia sp.]